MATAYFIATSEILGEVIKALPNDTRLIRVEEETRFLNTYRVTVEGDVFPEGTRQVRPTTTSHEDGSVSWNWNL